MSKYSFRQLPPSEITNQLRVLNIPVNSEDDIIHPRMEKVKEIYISLMEVSLRKPYAEMVKFDPAVMRKVRYPELCEQSIPNLILFKKIRDLLNRIGCPEEPFSLRDLAMPDPKRTRRFISAFINYIRFITEETELIMDQGRQILVTSDSQEEYQKNLEEYNKIQTELQQLKRVIDERKPIVNQKKEEIQQMTAKKDEILRERQALNQEIQVLEAKLRDAQDTRDRLRNSKIQLEGDIEQAKSRIVKSPEKYIEPMLTLQSQYESLEQGMKHYDNEHNKISQNLEAASKLIDKLQEANLLLEPYEASYNSYMQYKQEYKDQKRKALEIESNVKKQEIVLNNLTRTVQANEEQLNRTKTQQESRLNQLEHAINDKSQIRNQLIADRAAKEDQLRKMQQKYNDLQQQIEIQTQKGQAELELLQAKHQEILAQAQEYKENMVSMLSQCTFMKNEVVENSQNQ